MPSTVYAPADMPTGTSWVYTLNAQDAVDQCHVLGITPDPTLPGNRALLSAFLKELELNGGTKPTPTNHRPDLTTPVDGSTSKVEGEEDIVSNVLVTTTEVTQVSVSPPVSTPSTQPTTAVVTTAHQTPVTTPLLGSLSVSAAQAGPSHSSVPPALSSSHQPSVDWIQVVQATAVAVGQQVAAAMSSVQSPPNTGNSRFRVLDDLVRALPITSGTEPRKLIEFLVAATKIGKLALFNNEDLLLAILPRTTEQLRVFWLRGISDRAKLDYLVASVRDFFLPSQVRHATITTMVYRVQQPSESLPEFVESITGTSALLIPHFSQQDILDTVLNGLNRATRAALAAFPAACSLSDLLALVPRVQVVRALEEEQTASRTNSFQQNANARPSPGLNSGNAPHNSGNYRSNSQRNHNYRPNNHHNTQPFSDLPYNPQIPQFPYHQHQGHEPTPYQQPNRLSTPRHYGQGNGKGGQR